MHFHVYAARKTNTAMTITKWHRDNIRPFTAFLTLKLTKTEINTTEGDLNFNLIHFFFVLYFASLPPLSVCLFSFYHFI